MVDFHDPIQNITLSYHIDKNLRKKWDKLRDGKLKKSDEDRCYLVDGRERSGKSVFTFQQAKYIDPTFDINRVCFSPDEFLEAIRTAKRGQVVVFDEAFRGLSSKGSQSKVNKKIIQALMEVGQRNLIIFIVLPTFFLLEMYAAVLRSNVLFHVFKDKKGTRRVRVYNYQKKSLLYNTGKKKGFSYAFPKVRYSCRFFNKYAIDEQAYRKKKGDSFKEPIPIPVDDPTKNEEYQEKLEKLLLILKNYANLSQRKLYNLLQDNGFVIGRAKIGEICAKRGEKVGGLAP